MTRPHRFAALLAVAIGLLSCRSPEPGPADVIVVLVDTLRADHLGAYGYARSTSPGFDALAAESVLFLRARSQAPCTFPSVNSLLSSRHPLDFFGQSDGRIGFPDSVSTLQETLSQHGFSTAAVSASPVVRRSPSKFNPHGGFDRGFEIFDESCDRREAACLVERALEILDERDSRPFLLYLHFYDPHEPYQPPLEHIRRFAGDYEGRLRFVPVGRVHPVAQRVQETGRADFGGADLDHLIDLYDEEIAYWDGQFGRLLEELELRALLDSTIVAVLSDHGESFLEHGEIAHCRTLYDPEIRIPFLLRLPGAGEGRVVETAVDALDLVPTLLDLLGIEGSSGLEGRSLRPLFGKTGPEQLSFSLSGPWRSVTDGRFKLLLDLESRQRRLFDLREDPGEQVDLGEQHPAELRRLEEALVAWIRHHEGAVGAAESQALTEQAERQLRALGYLP